MIAQPTTVDEIEAAPEFADLAAEYDASRIEGMPPANPDWEMYRRLESAGLLFAFSATVDGRLVGYISVLVSVLPRYSARVATVESYFVAKAHRKTGAGLKLLKLAEDKARELNAPPMLVSAPADGDLAQVLPRLGYRATSTIFFKRLPDA